MIVKVRSGPVWLFYLCCKTGGDKNCGYRVIGKERAVFFFFSCDLVLHPVNPWYIIDCVK